MNLNRRSHFHVICSVAFLLLSGTGLGQTARETFLEPLGVKNDPYFKKGYRQGLRIGEKHAVAISCNGEQPSFGTEITWADPKQNPYAFGYALGYEEAFAQGRVDQLLNCAKSPNAQPVQLGEQYKRIQALVQAALDALTVQSCSMETQVNPCGYAHVCLLPDELRPWGFVVLTAPTEFFSRMNELRLLLVTENDLL